MRLGFCSACLSLLVSGCFNPDQSDDADTDPSSSTAGESTAPTSDGTTPTTSSSTDPTTPPDTTASSSSDGTGDDPPTVELLVDGSTMPGDVTHSGRIPLTAEATDDGTVVRVDFFDGDTLVASDESEPFEAALLLTSLDNDAHTLRAVAVDDADQQGESAPVGLAVNIDGGSTVASETNLFQMGGLVYHPGIGIVHDEADNVIVVGSLTTEAFEVTGVGAISLSPDLSGTNWQLSVPMSLIDGQPQFLTCGQPVLDQDAGVLFIGGNSMGTDGVIDANASVFRLAADGSGPLPFLELPSDPMVQNLPVGGIARDPEGNIALAGPDDFITKMTPMDGTPLWQSSAGRAFTLADLGGTRLRADAEGDFIFDSFFCPPMAMGCTLQTTKINGFDGNALWSQDIMVGSDEVFMHTGGSTPGPDGRVLTLHGPPVTDGGGLHLVVRDENGMTQQDTMLGTMGDAYSVADVAYDAQGMVVAVGTVLPGGDQSTRQPFAVRFDEQGNVQWQRTFGFGATNDQAMALALDRQGRLVVVGIADIEFIFFVAFVGDVWVAQLDL